MSVDKDHEGYVYRPNKVTIKAYNLLEHKDVEIVARGYDAIVLQHEFDHLNGVLFIDKLSIIKRKKFEKALKQKQKA